MEEDFEAAAGPAPPEDVPLGGSSGPLPEAAEVGKFWARPPAPALDPARDSLCFQQLEIDYTVERPHPRHYASAAPDSRAPVLRCFGVTREGNSVCVQVHGFEPYFYVTAPPGFSPDDLESFRQVLNARLAESSKDASAGGAGGSLVLRVELESKRNVMGYQPQGPQAFLRVTVVLPNLVTACRTILEQGIEVPGLGQRSFLTFESNVLYTLRFMIDRGIVGGNWLELPAGKYSHQTGGGVSLCQYNLALNYADLVSYPCEGPHQDVAKLRVLSIDIECQGRKGHFPEAHLDPVIQIASLLTVQGDREPLVRNIHTLGSCAPIVGAEVMSFDDEKDLMRSWANLVRVMDPDIIIGYNILKFDLPYLIDRANKLKVREFSYLGRVKNSMVRMRDTVFSSRAYGTRESKEITIDGRVQFDLFTVIQRDHKLSSYSLNNVSATFLGEQKEDVHHSCITDLQNGNEVRSNRPD